MNAQLRFERQLWSWLTLIFIGLMALNRLALPLCNFELAYVLPVMLSLWVGRPAFTFFVAVVSTCMVLWLLFLSVTGIESLWAAGGTRLVTIAVIWIAAILGVLHASRVRNQSRGAIEELHQKLEATRDIAVQSLAKVAESRDMDTGRHLDRICAYSLILANELQKSATFRPIIDDAFLVNLRQACLLHDIGKVAIRDDILRKPGALTHDERSEMKQHTVIGTAILDDVIGHYTEAGFLEMAAIIARCHHERFDGQGYPTGLSGRAIPLPARIVALADVYDALTSERPYKNAYAPKTARKTIELESGKQFDPVVVEAFLNRFDDFVAVQLRYPSKHVQIFGLTDTLVAEYCS